MTIFINEHNNFQEEDKNMHPDVKIYTLSTCSHCKAAEKSLDDCVVKYNVTTQVIRFTVHSWLSYFILVYVHRFLTLNHEPRNLEPE